MRLRRALLVGATALAFGGAALSGAGPAQAATAAAPASTSSYTIVATSAAPAVVRAAAAVTGAAAAATCGNSNYDVKVIGTHWTIWLCGVQTYNTTGKGPFQSLIIQSANRVWFHQYSNNSGWADCFSNIYYPAGYTEFGLGGRDQNPGNIQVSANTAYC